MSNPSWYKPTAPSAPMQSIPVGTYAAVILGAKEETTQSGAKRLRIQLDVSEGEQKDFFKNQFEKDKASRGDSAIYNGTVTLWYPRDDGSEEDGWTVKKFNSTIGAIEASNEGFEYDFTRPASLKGKKCGIAVREFHGMTSKGNPFDTTEIGTIIGYEYAKSGSMKPMKPRYHKDHPANPNGVKSTPASIDVGGTVVEEELPF